MGKSASKEQYADLFDAASRGDVKGVKYFVERKRVSIDSLNAKYQNAAHVAVEHGHLNVLEYLLRKNPSLFLVEDDQRNTIFHIALKKGSLDIVAFLMHLYKADVFKKTPSGETPLQLAAENGHLDVVRYLIDKHEANLLERASTKYGDTAIHSAAKHGRLNVVGYFLEEKKIDVNVLNGKGQPPVFSATIGNHTNIVRYLVEEHRANVTLIDEDHNTILHHAFANENLAVPRYLLDEKNIRIDLNAANKFDETLVLMAIERHDMRLLKYVVGEKKAEVNIADRYGEYPLHKAAKIGTLELVQYLVARGADPAAKNFYGKTPLDVGKLHNKYFRHGLPSRLLGYLELISPRRRRSVYNVHRSIDSVEFSRLEGTVVAPTRKFLDSEYVNDFLSLARLAVAKSHYDRSLARNESKEVIIERKIEPLAIDAVNGVGFSTIGK